MSQWYYVDTAQQQQGPVSLHDLLSLRVQGRISTETLVWREGWSDWRPLADALAEAGNAMTTPATPLPTAVASAPITSAPTAGAARVVPAGFLRRWAALFIDNLLLSVAVYALAIGIAIVLGIAGSSGALDAGEDATVIVLMLVFYAAYFTGAMCYYAGFESGGWQATLGKRAMGIKVVDAHGRRLSFAQAAMRWFAALLSYITLYVGFLMALFTARKETLHDKVTNTQVVDQWAYTDWPERQRDGAGGCGVALAIVGGLALIVAIIGILAAIAVPAYQDYLGRAKVAEALSEASVAKMLVEEHIQQSGECPTDLESLGASSRIGTDGSLSVTPGKADQCRLELYLPSDAGAVAYQRMWLQRDDAGSWSCGADFDEKHLPASCRVPSLPGPGA